MKPSLAARPNSSRFGAPGVTVVALVGAAALALMVHLPTVTAPLLHDDYAQRAMVAGQILPARGAFNLYDFVADDDRALLLARGAIPWWCSRDLTIRFLRPLSSVLVWADIKLFDGGAVGGHVHSLAWWALAVVGVWCLLRHVLGTVAATVAAFAFACAPSQAAPLLWLANRSILVCAAFGSFALWLYVRWREGERPLVGVLSGALFAGAFAGGEYAVGLTGYVIALEGALDPEPFLRRLRRSLPFTFPLAAYLCAHALLGYGSRGSGFYTDPAREPLAYLAVAPRRASVLMGEAWGTLDDFAVSRLGAARATSVGAATFVITSALVVLALRPRSPRRKSLAWLAGGAAMSLVPALAAEPSARVLDVAMIGTAGTLGALLDRERWRSLGEGFSRDAAWLVTGVLAIAQLVGGPLRTVREAREFTAAIRALEARMASVRERLVASNVIVLRAISPPAAFWMPFALGDRAPARWRVLTMQSGDLVAVRTGARTLEVTSTNATLFPTGGADLFREDGPLRTGEAFAVTGMRVTILDVDAGGRAVRARFEFDEDLDAPATQTWSERQSGFEPLREPAIGEGVRLAR